MRLARWVVRGTTLYILFSFIGAFYYFPASINGEDILYVAGFISLALITDKQLERQKTE